ncbi:DUF4112 domain-containing protein [Sphingomonas endophytica]|jgi:hypothetical protein|uniref:DUF4112 domain-containing protein n=1 Tax=Sphingomonas endophytica TaxID=869719 RepID=A0A7X0JAD7_9SPHN|nr:DUF4112 domain-containing protein [Sphingomonas endophytica]MBB5725226.1 hypothetical protein [Sphingomonas endophytica]MBB6503991.1 hypothetical protein [Sphingomonas endophytica]
MNARPTPLNAGLFAGLPVGTDPAAVRRRVEAVERLLEGLYVIPGLNRRVGLDAIVGLVPVVGDLLAGAMGMWLVWEARNLGMGRLALFGMTARVGFDTVLGMVPLVGDAADFFYRSNTRNLKRIKKHLDRHHPATVTLER